MLSLASKTMLNFMLVLLVPLLLAWLASRVANEHADERGQIPPLVGLVLLGVVARVLVFVVTNNVQIFSHGIGGDWSAYGRYAEYILAIWNREGMHFVYSDEFPPIGATSLPPNFFAFIAFFNGGEIAREGCAMLSVLFVGVTALNLFSLSIELGAPQPIALRMVAIIMLMPTIAMYSSDMYKDPMVWLLTFGMLSSSLRLLRKLSTQSVVTALLCTLGLWHVRFYLVFITTLPLAIGLLGLDPKRPTRSLMIMLGGIVVLLPLLAYTQAFGDLTDRAAETFENATDARARVGTANIAGSGVVFDDGGNPYAALPQKLVYTLFAPFPWQAGTIAMHVGKLDALLTLYLAYRSIRGAKWLLTRDPSTLFGLLSFAAPATLAYAVTMNNVGTVIRQRIPIVLVLMLLASLSFAEQPEDQRDEDEDEEDDEHQEEELDEDAEVPALGAAKTAP